MTGVEQATRSKHSYPFFWRGIALGWRSHTKSYLTRADRLARRKAQRAARKAGR